MSNLKFSSIVCEAGYLPPIAFFAAAIHAENVLIESCEHYQKRSMRNRCLLAGPDGLICLSIPLERGKNNHQPIKEVRISMEKNWKKIHWQTLESAYRRSPFFEYYEDRLSEVFFENEPGLFNFNLKLIQVFLEILKIPTPIRETETWQREFSEGITDLRGQLFSMRPEQVTLPGFRPPVYTQVFSDRNAFIPNLSIADLLFNCGPGSKELISASFSF